MKGKWTSILGLFSVLIIGLPTYAHARGGYGEFIGLAKFGKRERL